MHRRAAKVGMNTRAAITATQPSHQKTSATPFGQAPAHTLQKPDFLLRAILRARQGPRVGARTAESRILVHQESHSADSLFRTWKLLAARRRVKLPVEPRRLRSGEPKSSLLVSEGGLWTAWWLVSVSRIRKIRWVDFGVYDLVSQHDESVWL